jgi:hypothetical protein
VITSIKVWSTNPDPILSDLCKRLSERKLFKVVFYKEEERSEINQLKIDFLAKFQFEPNSQNYYWIEDETSNRAYNSGDEKIKIYFKDGKVKEISQVENTLISAGLLLPVKKHYICYLRQ